MIHISEFNFSRVCGQDYISCHNLSILPILQVTTLAEWAVQTSGRCRRPMRPYQGIKKAWAEFAVFHTTCPGADWPANDVGGGAGDAEFETRKKSTMLSYELMLI